MKSDTRSLVGAILAIAFMTLCVFAATAQTNEAITNSVDARSADIVIRDYIANFSYWKLMIVPITGVICFVIKRYIAKIPNGWIPIIGPILGGLLDVVAAKFGFWTGDAGAGAMMGALATWAHQLFVQANEAVANPEPPKADA